VRALRTRRREAALRVLLLVTAADLLFVVAFRMQQGTEYKFVFTAAAPLAAVALLGLEAALARTDARPLARRALLATSALYLAGPTLLFLAGALASGHFREAPLALDGRTFTRVANAEFDGLLGKVRRELPPDTVVVAALAGSEKSPNNDAFLPAAIAARDLYLVDDRELTRRLAPFDERADVVRRLFRGVQVAAATAALKQLHRPVALLLTQLVEVDFAPIPPRAGASSTTATASCCSTSRRGPDFADGFAE
jgi:hypothetical protein